MPSLFGRSKTKKAARNPLADVDELGRPTLKRSMSDSQRRPPSSLAVDEELLLNYGYWQVEPSRNLDAIQVEAIVAACGNQIKARSLQEPMLFSSRALDLDSEGVAGLIRSYLSSQDAFKRNLVFASPHDLAGMIKWSLARFVSSNGTHGFLSFQVYERWRLAEREAGFQPTYVRTHLLNLLPSSTSQLLSTLFSLLTSCLAYTSYNGTTPRKIAALFSSYIFGLPADQPFETTYSHFIRFTNATEHLILAYIRDPRDQPISQLPTKLAHFVKNYPKSLAANVNHVRSDVRLTQVARISRLVRFYSQDLIQTASTWEVPRSKSWAALHLLQQDPALTPVPTGPVFTQSYKHLLNIKPEEEEEDERFRSLLDRDWAAFRSGGFQDKIATKLQFDLTESERLNRKTKRNTLEWSAFASVGFDERESYLAQDLSFDSSLTESVAHLPDKQKAIVQKVKKIEKTLPDFPFDITPSEQRQVWVDELFFEVYADVLVASGWTKEEIKESSWVLAQYKSLPTAAATSSSPASPLTSSTDARTAEQWVLVEEAVPAEYRQHLLEGKTGKKSKRTSFLKVKKKPKKDFPSINSFSSLTSVPTLTASRVASPIDDSVFQSGYGSTKKITLADQRLTRLTPGSTPYDTPVPSSFPSRSTSLKRVAPPSVDAFAPTLGSTAEEHALTFPPLPRKVGNTSTTQPPLRDVFDTSSDKSKRASVDSGFFARVTSLTKGRRRKGSVASNHSFNFAARSFSEEPLAPISNYDRQRTVSATMGPQHPDPRDDAWVDILLRSEKRHEKQQYDPTLRRKRSQSSLNERPSVQMERSTTPLSDRPLPPPPFDDVSVAPGSSNHATEGAQEEEEEMEPLPEQPTVEDIVWRGSKHMSTLSANSGSLRGIDRDSLLLAPSPTRDYNNDEDEEAEEVADPPASQERPLPSPIAIPDLPSKDLYATKYDSIVAERGDSPTDGTPSHMSDRVSRLVAMYTKRSDIPVATNSPSLPQGLHRSQNAFPVA